jgi:glycosyltransferase involved in cell wall biosynthesis
MPGAELWILGNGPAKPALEDLARRLAMESKIRFFGTVLPQEIPGWIQQCDVGVLPTRQDVFLDLSFSSKLSEYVIMNKAVIASRLRTIRHYFSEDGLAFFEPEQPRELASQMVNMYQDPVRRAHLAAHAMEEYAPIRWAVMKKRYLALMERITTPNAAGRDDALRTSEARPQESVSP